MSVKASPLQISEGVLGDLAPASHHSSMASGESGHRNVHATAATPRRLVLRKEVS